MNKVFVHTVGYSGSGAVLDWLRDQRNVAVSSFDLFDYPHPRLQKKQTTKIWADLSDGGYPLKQIIFFMVHILAWRVLRNETVYRGEDTYNPEVKTDFPTWAEGVLDLATMIKCFFLFDHKSRKSLIRAHINQKLENQICDQELIAINKSFPLGSEKIAERFLDVVAPAKVILVVRNPADQVAAFYGSTPELQNKDRDAVRLFVKTKLDSALKRVKIFEKLEQKHPDVFRLIWLEDFLLKHDGVIKDLASFLGFPISEHKYTPPIFSRSLSLSLLKLEGKWPWLDACAREHPYTRHLYDKHAQRYRNLWE